MSKRLALRKPQKPNTLGSSFSDLQLRDLDDIEQKNNETTSQDILERGNNNEIPKRYQTDTKGVLKRIPNGYQTDTKRDTKEKVNGYQTDTQRDTKEKINGYQTDTKRIPKLEIGTLVGKEKLLLIMIYKSCARNGSLISEPITLEAIRDNLNITSSRSKGVIRRLAEKGITHRVESKTGRGGWIKFGLIDQVYKELRFTETNSNGIPNGYQTDTKGVLKRIPKGIPKPPSSSSSDLINKKTTTTTLDEDLGIQIPTNLKKIGFGVSHVHQVLNSENLRVQELQESLTGFAYDLEHNLIKSRTKPLNFLMGVLLKNGPYTSEAMVVALQKDLDDHLKKTKEFERAKETLKEMEVQKKFDSWLKRLSKENKNKLAPPNDLIKEGSNYQVVMLKNYWEKHIMESQI